MVRLIAARELRLMFISPLAWTILAVVQFLVAYVFLSRLEVFMQHQARIAALETAPGVTDLVIAPTLGIAGFIMLLVAPIVTMRAVSEDRRSGTLTLLLASPASLGEIVLGKFLGLIGFFAIMLLMIGAMPLSLAAGAAIDVPQLLSGMLGLLLMLASFAAIGLYLSSLTAMPAVAAVSTFGALLALWMLETAGNAGAAQTTVLNYLSVLHHLEPLLQGLLSTADLVYFILLTGVFLTLSVWRLDADRRFR